MTSKIFFITAFHANTSAVAYLNLLMLHMCNIHGLLRSLTQPEICVNSFVFGNFCISFIAWPS